MTWERLFKRGIAKTIDGDEVFGTATYSDNERGVLMFRKHPRNMAIGKGHAPLPDPGAIEIALDEFSAEAE